MTSQIAQRMTQQSADVIASGKIAGVKLSAPKNSVLTTWDDLAQAGISPKDVENMYEEHFKKKPDNEYLNEDICKEYGHYCYNIQGTPKYYNQKKTKMTSLGNERIIANNSDVPATYHVTLSSSHSKSASVTVTNTASFSFGSTITMGSELLGIGAEFQTTFSIENSVGSTSTTSSDVTVSDSIDITLQPRQKVVARLDVSWESLTEEFEIPFTIEGWTGAKFGKRVEGHYYWFLNLSVGFPTPTSTLRGTVESSYDIKGYLHVDPVE